MFALVAVALLAFSEVPLGHAPVRETPQTPLDRAFFIDSKKPLVTSREIEAFPHELATPLYDSPTKRLYVGTRDGVVRCFDRGRPSWSYVERGPVIAAPVLGQDDLYVALASGELQALNRFTGALRWTADLREELTTAPTLAAGKLFVMSSEDAVTAVSLEGKPLWKFRREPGSGFTIRGNARPVSAHGLLYTGFSDGSVVALAPDTGVAKWLRNVSGTGDYLDVDALAAPEEDKNVYAASAKAGVVALNATTGDPLWTYALPGANQIIADGPRVIAAGRGAIVALSRTDGRKLWQLSLGNEKYATAPAVSEGLLLISIDRGALLAIEADTGRARGAFDPGSGFSQAVLALRGAAMVISNQGELFTLGLLP